MSEHFVGFQSIWWTGKASAWLVGSSSSWSQNFFYLFSGDCNEFVQLLVIRQNAWLVGKLSWWLTELSVVSNNSGCLSEPLVGRWFVVSGCLVVLLVVWRFMLVGKPFGQLEKFLIGLEEP